MIEIEELALGLPEKDRAMLAATFSIPYRAKIMKYYEELICQDSLTIFSFALSKIACVC